MPWFVVQPFRLMRLPSVSGNSRYVDAPESNIPRGRHYFLAVAVISMRAAGAASLFTPTVVRAGLGSLK